MKAEVYRGMFLRCARMWFFISARQHILWRDAQTERTSNLFELYACYHRPQARLAPSKGEFQRSFFALSKVEPDRLRFLSIITVLKTLTDQRDRPVRHELH